jgi:arylsulfatase A-like enzyme
MPFNRWKPLDPDEATFLKRLSEKNIPSMLITDTANNVTGNVNLFRDYTAWTVNRGQEGDKCWLDENVPLVFPVPHPLIRYRAEMWHQILMNRAHRMVESDWFAPGTYTIAMKWLERNYRRKDFFLWIDTFDPHEPWDPPEYYINMYDPGYKGRVFDAPTYGLRRKMGITDRELKHTRARYAAEVTMVDTWFGQLLQKIERLGVLDETVIIFTSDHGTNFDGPGDFGTIQKTWIVGEDGMLMSAGMWVKEPKEFFPLSRSITRIPLMIHVPGMKNGKRIKPVVQPWDITSTILDIYGIPRSEKMTGQSVLPLIGGKKQKGRELAISGMAEFAQATTERWMYTVWRGQRPAALYDLKNDPGCRKNVAAKETAAVQMLHGKIAEFVRRQGIGEEYIAGYKA